MSTTDIDFLQSVDYFLPILLLVFTDIADIGAKYLSISVKKIHQYRSLTILISVDSNNRYSMFHKICGY